MLRGKGDRQFRWRVLRDWKHRMDVISEGIGQVSFVIFILWIWVEDIEDVMDG